MMRRLYVIFMRLFKPLKLWRVTLHMTAPSSLGTRHHHTGGHVTVTPVLKSIFRVGTIQIFEVLNDLNLHSHTEFSIWVEAVDPGHAIERGMPSLEMARSQYLKMNSVNLGNIGNPDNTE